jgi:hypothetical protein
VDQVISGPICIEVTRHSRTARSLRIWRRWFSISRWRSPLARSAWFSCAEDAPRSPEDAIALVRLNLIPVGKNKGKTVMAIMLRENNQRGKGVEEAFLAPKSGQSYFRRPKNLLTERT